MLFSEEPRQYTICTTNLNKVQRVIAQKQYGPMAVVQMKSTNQLHSKAVVFHTSLLVSLSSLFVCSVTETTTAVQQAH